MDIFSAGLRFHIFFLLFLSGAISVKAGTDTLEIIKNIDLARNELSDNPRKSIALSLKALQLARQNGNKKFIAKAYNTIGSAYYYLGIYDSAEVSHQQALELQLEINDTEGLGRSYTNIGSIYSDRGLNDKAIKYFLMAEKKFDQAGYRPGQAKLNNSLGILFYNIKDYSNAIKYFSNGLKIAADFNDKSLYYSITVNLANSLGDAGKLNEAIALYKESYNIAKANNNYYNLMAIYNNICQTYIVLHNADPTKHIFIDSVKKYDRAALQLLKEQKIEDEYYKIIAYTNHATILYNDALFKEAVPFLDSAIYFAKTHGDLQKQIGLYKQLSITFKKTNNLPGSIKALEQANYLSDSLYSKNMSEKLSELNAIHNVEKKEAEITILNSEKKNQKKVNILLIVVIILAVISLLVTIYNYLGKRKDNELISLQKQEVELKNKVIEEKQHEIIDSITYAKRLQDAILPAESYFKKHLPQSFVLYQPKDIVAGDFYWMETINSSAGEKLVLFAAADCTGHGVPGAMGSVVCSNALNRSVLEFKLETPGEILDKTRQLVIATFEKSSTEVKDGMDISFCCLNTNTLELQWSGANNPLWIIRNGGLIETKADKQPIGKYDAEKPFTTHSFKLNHGDLIYLLTDGYADQFGGPDGKKFKYKPLKEKLVALHSEPMPEQQHLLHEIFSGWKKDLEQVDDVCMIGVKI